MPTPGDRPSAPVGFRERIETPTKHWKITPEDIRNRARQQDYLTALDDMFQRTSTAAVPWRVVPAEFKWFARLAVGKTVVRALCKGLALGLLPRPGSRQSNRKPRSQ